MKNAFLALVSMLSVAACNVEGVKIPGHDAVLVCEMESGCENWDVNDVAVFMDRFSAQWKKDFGAAPKMPSVIFVKDAFFAGMNFEDSKGDNYMGYANEDEVHVVGKLDGRILSMDASVFAHEMIHGALLSAEGDSDHDHAAGEGPWSAAHDRLLSILDRGADLPVL